MSILNGVRIKITHNIAPVNLHSSINSIGVSRRSNVCLILTDLDSLLNLLIGQFPGMN